MGSFHDTGALTGPRLTRLALGALGLVLLCFVALSVVGGVRGSRSAEQARTSGDLVESYLLAHDALSTEDEIEDAYKDDPDPALRPDFEDAAAQLDRALARLASQGGPNDRALARAARPVHRRYAEAMRDRFVAFDAGDEELAEAINEARADPAQDELQRLVNGMGPGHAIAALAELDELLASERTLLRATLVAVPAGAGLYLLVLLIFARYRRRLDEATATEVDRLRESLLRDPVTGVRNHRAYQEDLERDFAGPAAEHCLALADIVGFRTLNETRGHAVADERLKAVALALSDAVGEAGRCYRVGADEFAILLPGQTAWTGLSLVEHARRALGADVGSRGVRFGVARADREEGKDALVRRANLAHVAARRSQRSAVVYSSDLEPGEVEADGESEGRRALTTALAQAVDAKDPSTRSHCETVSAIAALVATELGVDPSWVAQVRLAGLLHDVGKIGIPDSILHKPGTLDDAEWEIMRSHARLGSDILAAAGLHDEAVWVLHHHERPDGRGYPHGLARDAVPLESRIILTADTFEAITSDRPYRRGRSADEALEEIRRHTGTQFDPACVGALERVLGRDEAALPDDAALALPLP